MKSKFIALFLAAAASASALTITSFDAGAFTFDSGSSVVGTSLQGETSFSFTGDGASFFAGLIAPSVDLGIAQTITLNATITSYTAPATTFYIDLYDQDFDYVTYEGNWIGFVATVSRDFIADLQGQTLTGGGAFDNTIVAVGLRLGSTGGSANISLNDLSTSAIPEPSSFAALAGLSVLGAVATRRRRSA